jgi:hypothetical protein
MNTSLKFLGETEELMCAKSQGKDLNQVYYNNNEAWGRFCYGLESFCKLQQAHEVCKGQNDLICLRRHL